MARAGKLDRRITIQRRGTVQNSFGELVEGWTDLVTLWARFEPGAGSEAFAGGAEQRAATKAARFETRYVDAIEAQMRLLYDGEVYDITDVEEIGRRRGLMISAYTRGLVSGA